MLEYKRSTTKRLACERLQDLLSRGLYRNEAEPDRERRLQDIEKEIGRSYPFQREEVTLTLHLKEGDSIRVASFSEAYRNKDIQGAKISGFTLQVACGEVICELGYRPGYPTLALEVRPRELRISSELFVELKRWVVSVKAPLWQRIVRRLDHTHWFIVLFLLLYVGIFGGIHKTRPSWDRIEQAHELLKDGIGEDEHGAALESILALLSEFGKPAPAITLEFWYILLITTGILACFLLSLIPGSVIDMGKDEGKVVRWRAYLRFISVTIPIAVFSTFLWPHIALWVKGLFSP